jgi:undecaprenyldiphospho-muramoylpentapeptide beta-N-acetylglucosaminyltransferase
VYPAMAILQALGEDANNILWVGGEGGMEADLVRRAGIPFTTIPAGQIHGVGFKAIAGLWKLTRGYFEAKRIIRRFKPDVLFFTGGFVSVPTGLAGRNIPISICLPDIEPALALRLVSKFADLILVPTEESKKYFNVNKKVTVTGYPTRADLSNWDRDKAFKSFDLKPEKPTLLVTGGSKGARSINQAILKSLPALLEEFQIIHISGKLTWPEVEEVQNNLTPELAEDYRPYPYLHKRMGAAFTAADLAITRGGASILGELPLFGLPAILVPYPYAWKYQITNANYLASRDAAIVIKDEDLEQDLLATIQHLMHNKAKLDKMKLAMQNLAKPQAARKIAGLIKQLSTENKAL